MKTYDHMMLTKKNTPMGTNMTTIHPRIKLKADSQLFKMFPKVTIGIIRSYDIILNMNNITTEHTHTHNSIALVSS